MLPGTYIVCLTVSDSGCTDTFCDSVYLGGFPNCQAGFTYGITPSGAYAFQDSSYSANPNSTSYHWDFGDGTTSAVANPTHVFQTPGPWLVCLTINDLVGNCSSTFCQVVMPPANGLFSVSGMVISDSSSMIYDGIAYLIQHDSITGTLTAIDTASILQNFYSFNNVAPGTYLIKAALLPSSPDYANYLPTYLGDELSWANATSTVVTNSNIFNPLIMLVPGSNPGGPGFIGGLISQGANKGPGDPLSDVSVLLLHNDGSASGHTVTDVNGEFGFSNLAYGTYKVHVEVAGKLSEEWTVTIDGSNGHFEGANFEVGSTQIHAVGTTGIDQLTSGEVLGIFPVPASEVLNVNLTFAEPVNLSLSLVNMMGQTVASRNEGLTAGNREVSLDVRNLPQGTYLLRIQADAQVVTRRVLIK
ncbi:MAG: PKD domain-containing protein [Bacteroidia bacterium]